MTLGKLILATQIDKKKVYIYPNLQKTKTKRILMDETFGVYKFWTLGSGKDENTQVGKHGTF